MKYLLFALTLALPNVSLAASKPKPMTCKGSYEGPRTIDIDGKGFCTMAFDNMTFNGTCDQKKDGSVAIYIAGNSFSGKFSSDCSELVIDLKTYKRK